MKIYAVIESNMYGPNSYVGGFFKSKQRAEDVAAEYNRYESADSVYFYFVREIEVSEK